MWAEFQQLESKYTENFIPISTVISIVKQNKTKNKKQKEHNKTKNPKQEKKKKKGKTILCNQPVTSS